MPQFKAHSVSMFTLGVKDVERSVRFYEALGWPCSPDSDPKMCTFMVTDNIALGLVEYDFLAKDALLPTEPMHRYNGFTMAINGKSAEEVDALIEAVKQRDIHARLHDLQNKTGKACAGSDIDDLFIRKIAHGQQRRTVEKMQARNILKSVYRIKIHDLVALFEIFVICLQSADCLGIRRDPERGKAVI